MNPYDKAVQCGRLWCGMSPSPGSLHHKEEIAAVDGVEDVIWLDDQVNIRFP